MAFIDLLPPQAAAQARHLEFFARTRVEGYLKGANASKLRGQSSDFLRHRQYQAGDDLRHLDWRVYARSDRLVTREFEEYTNLDVYLALDFSGSMAYPGTAISKLAFMRHCAALLAYALNLQRDRCGLVATTDRIVHFLKPAGGKKHLAELFRLLVTLEPAGETNVGRCVRHLLTQVRRKGVFLVFSDCYQEPDELTRALGTLRLQGHDVVLYQMHDRDEATLPFNGFTQFRDLETGQLDAADPLEIRAAYAAVCQEHLARLQAGCNRFGIEFHPLEAVPHWDRVMAQLLRERLRRP